METVWPSADSEAGFLRDASAGFEDGNVALDFVFEGFLEIAERV